MKRAEFFRGNGVVEALEVTKLELNTIKEKCSYVSISEADENNLKEMKGDEIVGAIFGDIDNIFKDVVDPNHKTDVVENPDCWFVNKDFIAKNYKKFNSSKFTFGEAITLLKLGYKVARVGWNGKGMWLVYVPGSEVEVKEGTPYWDAGLRGKLKIDGHIDMYTAQKTMQPGWLASQADIQAQDWVVVW